MPNIVKLEDGIKAVQVDDGGKIIGLLGPDLNVGGLPILDDKTASFTLNASHANQLLPINSGSAVTITVPSDATDNIKPETTFAFYRKGAGTLTLAAAAGVTINTPSSLSARAQHSVISLMKMGQNTWLASGDLT